MDHPKFTINLYNIHGVQTKTYYPKTIDEKIIIGPLEAIELIGAPVSCAIRIGDDSVTMGDGSSITLDCQPYCEKGYCIIKEPFSVVVKCGNNTHMGHVIENPSGSFVGVENMIISNDHIADLQ